MEMEKRIINLRHLFWTIIGKWKLILITAIICGIAGAGYAVIKQKIEDKNFQPEQTVTVSEEEFTEIKKVAKAYDMLEAQKEYNEQCIGMNCKDLSKGMAYMSYQIRSDNKLDINQIAAAYIGIFEDDAVYKTIEKIEDNMSGKYIKEGISCVSSADGILQLEIISYSEEAAQKWMKSINNYLKSQKSKIEKKLNVSYKINKISQSSLEAVDPLLAEQYIKLRTQLTTLQSSYDALMGKLTVHQSEYLTLYLEMRDDKDYVEGQSISKETEYNRSDIFKKRLRIDSMLACILGTGMIFVLILVWYFYSPKLINKEDLELMYNLPILGSISENKKYKDNDMDAEYKNIIAKIGIQNIKGEKIYIAGTSLEISVIERLKKESEDQDICFIQGKNFMEDPKAVIEIKDCDAVIFLEKERASKYAEIREEVKICRESGKKILGAIIIC